MKTVAIVPSAGSGRRLGARTKKPFILLGGHPLITYALKALDSSSSIDGIIIAVEPSCEARFRRLVKRYNFKKVIAIIHGGATRSESVRNCLKLVDPSYGVVLIHDGARPFVGQHTIEACIRAARKFGASLAAVPEIDTVKIADAKSFVKRTVDRKKVFRAQTPQVFRWDVIMKAYGAGPKKRVTDDSSLAEDRGIKVKIVMGSYRNIKITTREDLKMAEVLL